jgi:predicted glycosyltransferase
MPETAAQTRAPRADVLFYVQHLLGIGHLRRAAVIARALDRAGLDVVFATGGLPVAGLDVGGARLVQLPPVKTRDETFSVLVEPDGTPIGEPWKTARRERLLALYREVRPKALLIEMFPFGRRQMRFELLPLLDAARADRPRPQVVCSLRDVLTTHKTPGKTEWMLEIFARYFDLVLVHGDPAVIPLKRSFPEARGIEEKIRYTGYVVADMPPPGGGNGKDNVIVSTGGGAVAMPLIETVLAARPLTPLHDATWRILIGHNLPEARFRDLAGRVPAGVVVERSRPDFLQLLRRGRLSISQAGYNTVVEVLSAGIPAVVVPFAAGSEPEQRLRAQVLADYGALTVVDESSLTPATLAAGVHRALDAARPESAEARPPRPALNMDGAAKTARLLCDLIAIVST